MTLHRDFGIRHAERDLTRGDDVATRQGIAVTK
jgi:hypothetical protein